MKIDNIRFLPVGQLNSYFTVRIHCKLFFFQEKFNSISEEGCQSSDILERLKIPDLVLWTNDEVNTMAALCGENRIAAADQLDMCRELEKCRELLRVQYNLNSTYKKEVLASLLSLSVRMSWVSRN